MKDLVLINSPMQEYSERNRPEYFTTAPIGLGYLATIASQEGYDVAIIDAEAEKLSPREVIQRVTAYSPSVVGINAFSTNHELALGILDESPAKYRLVGGSHATLKPEDLKGDHTVVRGEAENIFLELLRKQPGGIVNAGFVDDLDALPFIDRRSFVNDPYTLENGELEASINTSRGCQFKCAYCSVPTINGRAMRARSIENVVDEIEELSSAGVDNIHFTDDLFNFTRERVEEFSDALSKSYANPSWRALCRVENLDEALLEKMKDSGCKRIAVGVESATPRILRYIGKNPKPERTKKVLGIETKAFFTIGYPTETEEEIERTLDFAMDLNPDDVRFMVVRAFPGTRLYEDMRKSGMSVEELDSYAQSTVEEAFVKYHVMNVQSLNGMPSEQLDNYIIGAYARFNEMKGAQHESIHSI